MSNDHFEENVTATLRRQLEKFSVLTELDGTPVPQINS